jgi:sortase A
VTGVLGRVLLCLGTVILLFVAYQLWGTGIAESHSQAILSQKLDHELKKAGVHPGVTPTTGPHTTSPTVSSDPAPTTADPNDGQPVGLLQIPRIGLDKVIVEGTTTSDLRQGPGHYLGTPLPGQQGNAAIAGHRTTYGAPFYNLNELDVGDPITVTTTQGVFTYQVTRSLVVPCGDSNCNDPADQAVIAASVTPELTLTTCNPRFQSSSRLVVQAALTSAAVTPKAAAATPTTTVPGRHHLSAAAAAADLAGGQGNWVPALWWGCAVVAAAVLVGMVARRRRRRGRLLVYGVGTVGVLAVLFFFFGAVSPLLPASF